MLVVSKRPPNSHTHLQLPLQVAVFAMFSANCSDSEAYDAYGAKAMKEDGMQRSAAPTAKDSHTGWKNCTLKLCPIDKSHDVWSRHAGAAIDAINPDGDPAKIDAVSR